MSHLLEIVLSKQVHCAGTIDILLSEGIQFEHRYANSISSFICQNMDSEQIMYKLVEHRVGFKYLYGRERSYIHILNKS